MRLMRLALHVLSFVCALSCSLQPNTVELRARNVPQAEHGINVDAQTVKLFGAFDVQAAQPVLQVPLTQGQLGSITPILAKTIRKYKELARAGKDFSLTGHIQNKYFQQVVDHLKAVFETAKDKPGFHDLLRAQLVGGKALKIAEISMAAGQVAAKYLRFETSAKYAGLDDSIRAYIVRQRMRQQQPVFYPLVPQPARKINARGKEITYLHLSGDNTLFIQREAGASLLDLKNGREVLKLQLGLTYKVSPNHRFIIQEGLNHGDVYDTHLGRKIYTISQPDRLPTQPFSPDSKWLYTIQKGGQTLVARDAATNKMRKGYTQQGAIDYKTVTTSANGRVVGFSSSTATSHGPNVHDVFHTFDTQTRMLQATIEVPQHSLEFHLSTDGTLVVYRTETGTWKVSNLSSPYATAELGPGTVFANPWSLSENWLCWSDGYNVMVKDADSDEIVASQRYPKGVQYAAFAGNGKQLFVQPAGTTWMHLLDLDTRTTLLRLEHIGPPVIRRMYGPTGEITKEVAAESGPVALSPAGTLLATTSGKEIALWNLATPEIVSYLDGYLQLDQALLIVAIYELGARGDTVTFEGLAAHTGQPQKKLEQLFEDLSAIVKHSLFERYDIHIVSPPKKPRVQS